MNLVERCRHGIMIYNRKDIWIGKCFDSYGEYSESEVAVFRDLLRPGNAVMDIGANIGSHTIPLARIVGEAGMVIALEPERHNFYTLCGNAAVNNLRNVWCFQQAAGSEAGTINVPEINYKETVNFGGLELGHDYSTSAHYPVPVNVIDEIKGGEWRLIKVDVEGMEIDVLRGAQATVERWKPVLYVEDDREAKSDDLRNLIDDMGYIMYRHEAPFWNPDNFAECPTDIHGNVISLNLFCHHKAEACPIDVAKHGMIPIQ